MQPPDELMTDLFLPAMRHLVAVKLRSRGLSQNRISSMLGVTQASVSLYLSSDPARAYAQLGRLAVTRPEADADAALLAEDLARGPIRGIRTLNRIWTGLLGAGSACPAHREAYPVLADCDFCIKEYGGKERPMNEIIADVAEAASLLEDSRDFIAVMPEVSVNIACAVPGATIPEEVVAIPGRIVRVKDRARAMLPPEAGASAHMSRVLLLAMRKEPRLTACINLRYDSRMRRSLARLGVRFIRIGSYPTSSGDDPTAAALEKKLSSSSEGFDAVVDEGGPGIESNVYLFANGGRDAAKAALTLARAYSAG